MAARRKPVDPKLPRGWTKFVRTGVLQALALANYVTAHAERRLELLRVITLPTAQSRSRRFGDLRFDLDASLGV